MGRIDRRKLIDAAGEAARRAVAPHSGFKVGAALLISGGEIVTGANVESASYGLTCCAERVALFKALSEGRMAVRALAVVADVRGGPMPCGACRQLLAEYAPDAVVWVADARRPARIREFTVRELLPAPFTLAAKKSVGESGPTK